MKFVDFILIFMLLAGLADGYRKGFIKSIIDLAAIIAGIVASIWLTGPVVSLIKTLGISQSENLPIIIGLIILILVLVMAAILSDLLKKLVNILFLKKIDSLLGSVLGLFLTAIFISFLAWIFNTFGILTEFREGSRVEPYLASVSGKTYQWLHAHVPAFAHFENVLKSFINS